jgi:DNA-binding ferritin-like protein
MHFQVTGEGSYAKHKALQKYYDAIPDLVDTLVESMQGSYEIITGYPASAELSQFAPLPYLELLQDYVRENRSQLPDDSEIQNEVDSILNLINSTVYKLRELR